MPHSHSIALQISNEDQDQLQTLQRKLQEYHKQCRSLNQPSFLSPHLSEKIQQSLSQIIAADTNWRRVLEEVHAQGGEHHVLQLRSGNNGWLNQFWRMAKCPHTGQMLADIPNLFLSKQVEKYTSESPFVADNPLPLKILVMISSPENSPFERRLDYEGEERVLLEAFEPLFEQGQVQIDFTDVGSLEALEEKLRMNRYHILHFSGHGNYHEGVGYLELEDHLTMDSKGVKAADFAAVLNAKPEHRPALVLLSSCLTARGGAESELSGTSNALLHRGIPAVIAMSGSIEDKAATQFAAELYGQIAKEAPLHRAFKTALQVIRQAEAEKWAKAGASSKMRPLQWLYPQIYQRQVLTDLVDWTADLEEVKLDSYRFVSGAEKMILKRSLSKQHYFVGRRKDKREAVPVFLAGESLLLKGQGGMGKTTMAEYLVQRRIAYDNRTHPFLFDQTANLETVLDSMSDALEDVYEDFDFQDKLERIKKGISKFKFLLKTLKKHCHPLFVFDNLETFQSKPNKAFKAEHSDIAEVIHFLYQTPKTPSLLLTCRYDVAECPEIHTVNLNHVGLNDFWKKVRYLHINRLSKHLQSQRHNIAPDRRLELSYKAVVTWLHETFGGNFRALEYFDEQFQAAPEGILDSIQSLNDLQAQYKDAKESTLRRMTTNLAFGQLLHLLEDVEQQSLYLLAQFQTPVKVKALELQNAQILYPTTLFHLQSLTLVEHAEGFYYVNPLTQELLILQQKTAPHPPAPFSHRKAGNYYYARYHNTAHPTIGEVEAGLHHYLQSKHSERVNELGGIILNYYYNQSAFRKALAYAIPIETIGGKEMDTDVRNRIGLIYDIFGEYEKALSLYQQNLVLQQQIGDKSGESTTLNNISQIYDAKGDYDTALKFLQQSLAIRQQIGDKSGEGTTLNNLATTAHAKGDYDTALKFLQQSLAIRQQIGDKSGEGTTLNNISQIYRVRGDYDTALKFLQQSLDISQQIGDRQGMSATLGNIAQIYKAWKDYEKAMEYMNADLEICRSIGDINGAAITLFNMGGLFFELKQFEEAVLPLLEAYNTFRKIGSPNVKAVESWLNALVREIGEERFKEIMEGK